MRVRSWVARGDNAVEIPSRTTVKLTAIGPTLVSPADRFLPLIMNEICADTRQDIHDLAYETDPYCPGIWLLAAEAATSSSSKAINLRQAALSGTMAFRKYEKEHELHWWGDVGTRSTLRAMYDAARLFGLNDAYEDEAKDCAEHLLELDPRDHLGGRLLLRRYQPGYRLG
ncbi:MAG: hypothetical protein E6Q98_01645 [Rhodospirillaceae bacterium]|nr:MAG: hypothetical protein E6Q98_01645 [Rhodospirillaceae bacterium]